VAIKKIEKAFEDRLYTKRTLRELKLLRLMSHDNIIGLDTIMLPKSRSEFEDIYCVNELMETDLRQIIKT
jgi:mitogen-activated protein kinase 1/3